MPPPPVPSDRASKRELKKSLFLCAFRRNHEAYRLPFAESQGARRLVLAPGLATFVPMAEARRFHGTSICDTAASDSRHAVNISCPREDTHASHETIAHSDGGREEEVAEEEVRGEDAVPCEASSPISTPDCLRSTLTRKAIINPLRAIRRTKSV